MNARQRTARAGRHLLALLLGTAAAAQAPQVGTCFALHAHGLDEATAKKALDACERTWPLVAAALGVPPAPPAQPLAVHLHRTSAGYEAAEQPLTNGEFRRDLAMVHAASKTAHVALQPPLDDAVLAAVGLPAFAVEVLAQQAAQLARLQLGAQAVQHPQWFADGLSVQVARDVREGLFPCGGSELAPTATNDVVRVQRLAAQKKVPPLLRLLDDDLDDLVIEDRAAVRGMFWRFLRSEAYRSKLAKLAEALRDTPAGDGYGKALQATVAKLLGASVDRDFVAFVQKGKPKWFEPYRALSTAGKDWPQIAFPNRNAVAWHQEPVKGGKLFASGSLRILPGGRKQMNFLFARNEQDEFYSLGFLADQGLRLFRYEVANEDFREVGKVDVPELKLGQTVPWKLEASGVDLTVRVGAQVCKFTLPVALPKEVSWGLGAQAGLQDGPSGSAGIWSEVVVGSSKR